MADETTGTALAPEPTSTGTVTIAPDANANGSTPAADWRATLPDDLKAAKSLERYRDVPGLAKAYVELEKTLGQRVPAKPGADAKPEAVAAWREAMGVPKDAAAYEFPTTLAPEAVETFRKEFHDLGIPAETAKALTAKYAEFEVARRDRLQQEWIADLEGVKKRMGEPAWNRRLTAGVRFVEQMAQEAGLDPGAVKAWFNETRLGDHPWLVQMFGIAGEKTLEDTFIDGDADGGVDAARARLDAIFADKTHPYNNDGHPGHQKALDEVLELTRRTLGKDGRRVVSTI